MEKGCRLAPDALEVVKLAEGRREQMDNHIAVVNQNPAGVGCSLDMIRPDREFICPLAEALGQRRKVSITRGRADNEVISQVRSTAHVEENDIFSLCLGQPVGHLTGQDEGIQELPPIVLIGSAGPLTGITPGRRQEIIPCLIGGIASVPPDHIAASAGKPGPPRLIRVILEEAGGNSR